MKQPGWGREVGDMLVIGGLGKVKLLNLALCQALFQTPHGY